MGNVLLVSDDAFLSKSLARVLRMEGHTVRVEADGAAGLQQAKRAGHALIIVDLQQSDLNGVDLCQRMRECGVDVPVLILTTRARESEMVVALDAWADDYVTKPFRLAELLARVRALLRRSEGVRKVDDGPIRLDIEARLVFLNEQRVTVSAKEFDLLQVLIRDEGQVVTRKALMEEVWGDVFAGTKTLDMHISTLRRRLGDDAQHPSHIITVRGVGFRFQNGPRSPCTLVNATGA